ncbi:uncharacterized protein AMSG_11008 [Thecamonas trahens ATCC 50062]|uniref:Uncharacterized protein n=1 Tax=Thecamonas trahens ATCC 50062 TaxID=461836 RepID=A0A0L0DV02_THETB|nr:hypothetical protein AMSG_11008 [Thecamonas trahens ATCC 50062]KNC55353.1 hypothetical protein AMSG_11008 [Thecamonas trahens ATCC 50062]|eukprot:XP_013753070.1 hypothetical protein AMSG_11008 [Thecamonas trahens ATCC 50062]
MAVVFIFVDYDDGLAFRSLSTSQVAALGVLAGSRAAEFATGAVLRTLTALRCGRAAASVAPVELTADEEAEQAAPRELRSALGPFGRVWAHNPAWAAHLSEVRDTGVYDGELVGFSREATFELHALCALALLPLAAGGMLVRGTPLAVLGDVVADAASSGRAFRILSSLVWLAAIQAVRPVANAHIVLHEHSVTYVTGSVVALAAGVGGAVVVIPGEAESVGVLQFVAVVVILACFSLSWRVTSTLQKRATNAAHAETLVRLLPQLAGAIDMDAYVASAAASRGAGGGGGLELSSNQHLLAMEQSSLASGHGRGSRGAGAGDDGATGPLALKSLLARDYSHIGVEDERQLARQSSLRPTPLERLDARRSEFAAAAAAEAEAEAAATAASAAAAAAADEVEAANRHQAEVATDVDGVGPERDIAGVVVEVI